MKDGTALTLGVVGVVAAAALVRRSGSRTQAQAPILQETIQDEFVLTVRTRDFGLSGVRYTATLHEADGDTTSEDDSIGHVSATRRPADWRPSPLCVGPFMELQRKIGRSLLGIMNVSYADLWDTFQGRGLGLAMYDALARVAATEGYAIAPNWCGEIGPDTSVSIDAALVWVRLAKRYPHAGDPFFWLDPEDPDAAEGDPIVLWGEPLLAVGQRPVSAVKKKGKRRAT